MIVFLIPIAALAMVFGIVYVTVTAKNREKMKMLERGFTPEEIAKLHSDQQKSAPYSSVQAGFILAGVGIGFFLATRLADFFGNIGFAIPSMICLSMGIMMIISHFVIRALKEKDNYQD